MTAARVVVGELGLAGRRPRPGRLLPASEEPRDHPAATATAMMTRVTDRLTGSSTDRVHATATTSRPPAGTSTDHRAACRDRPQQARRAPPNSQNPPVTGNPCQLAAT